MTIHFDPEKRYSCKSNASRAARTLGIKIFECHQDEDGWFFSIPAPETPKPDTTASKRKAALELRKDETAPKAAKKAEKAPRAEATEKAPSGMVAKILELASREEGCTPAELNSLTNWTGAPWKWLFSNPKKTGYCDRWGYTFEVHKQGREVCYFAQKN